MSITIAYCREMLLKHSKYKDSNNWKEKVYRMPADQVLAIYNRMLHNGEFDQKKKEEKRVEPGYTQPTLFDFGLEVGDDTNT